MYVYVGEKKATGNPAERAGLTGGTLYGIKVPGFVRSPSTPASDRHRLHSGGLGDVKNLTELSSRRRATPPR